MCTIISVQFIVQFYIQHSMAGHISIGDWWMWFKPIKRVCHTIILKFWGVSKQHTKNLGGYVYELHFSWAYFVMWARALPKHSHPTQITTHRSPQERNLVTWCVKHNIIVFLCYTIICILQTLLTQITYTLKVPLSFFSQMSGLLVIKISRSNIKYLWVTVLYGN